MYFMTGLALGAGLGFIAVVLVTRAKDSRLRLSELMNFRLETEKALETVREKIGAANALLIRVHNGGGAITVTSKLYSSVVTESYAEHRFSAIEDWQNIRLDVEYLATLVEVQKSGRLVLDTEKMRGGLLRSRYEAFGYTGAVLSEVYNQGGNSIFFLSLPFTEGILTALDGKGFSAVDIAENALRKDCSRMDDSGLLE